MTNSPLVKYLSYLLKKKKKEKIKGHRGGWGVGERKIDQEKKAEYKW